jgi:hypothetical protein
MLLFVHYYKSVLEHTCNIFTNFSHVIGTKCCVNEYYVILKPASANFMLIIILYVLMYQDILRMEESITFFPIKIRIFFED